MKTLARFVTAFAALTVLTPLPAFAEYLAPDWSDFYVPSVSAPNWIAGARDGAYIGMCVACDGTMLLEVRVNRDDGTGERVRSGETTAETYTELGKANASQLGGDAEYYGTEDIAFASAVGFATHARIGTGDYSSTYQLWSDGQQLIVRVVGKDRAMVDAVAEDVYEAATPLTFR